MLVNIHRILRITGFAIIALGATGFNVSDGEYQHAKADTPVALPAVEYSLGADSVATVEKCKVDGGKLECIVRAKKHGLRRDTLRVKLIDGDNIIMGSLTFPDITLAAGEAVRDVIIVENDWDKLARIVIEREGN